MGIERFFAFIDRNFSDLLKTEIPYNSNYEVIEGLYLDVNSFLHPICQAIFMYNLDRELSAEDLKLMEELRSMNKIEIYAIVKECIGRYIFHAFEKVKPKSVLMLAVDGPAPKAKINQQRTRRVNNKKSSSEFFDPVMISPGTPFMDEIGDYLQKRFVSEYAPRISKVSRAVRIIYSGHREYGEGEHKIFDQMRLENPRGKARFNVVMGEDSDLAVISMLQNDKIIWMRGNFRSKSAYSPLDLAVRDRSNDEKWNNLYDNHFQYMRIDILASRISNRYLKPYSIAEFVAMTTMMGNDFIPAIADLDAISYTGNDVTTMEEILEEHRKYSKGSSAKNQPKKSFSADNFKTEFNELARKWVFDAQGKISTRIKGIWNSKKEVYEVFPYVVNEHLGIRERVRYFATKEDKFYHTRDKDVGTLLKVMKIFSDLRQEISFKRVGRQDDFTVEEGRIINFPNLYILIKRLNAQSQYLLNSQSAKHKMFMAREKIPSKVAESSVGYMGTSKDHSKPAYVPQAFSHLQEVHAFGIYDSEYVDPHLPKSNLDEMCRSWLEGLQYTFFYYKSGLRSINVRWEYLYDRAPTLFHLENYLENRLTSIVPLKPHVISPPSKNQIEVKTLDLVDKAGEKLGELDLFEAESINYIHIELLDGSVKVIEADQVQLVRYGFLNSNLGSKPILYYTNPRSEFYKVKRTFSSKALIREAVANKKIPYPSLIETAFMIMPERALRLLFSPDLVTQVISQLHDVFPDYYELEEEGALYEPKARMIFPDSERVKKVIENLPDNFNYEIGAFNRRKDRLHLLRGMKKGSEVIRILEDKKSFNYPVIIKQSLNKDQGAQKADLQTKGGWGDSLGRPLPEHRDNFETLFRRPKAYTEMEIEKKDKTIMKSLSLQEFYNPLFMREDEKAVGMQLQNSLLNFPFPLITWNYENLPDSIQVNYRFEIPFDRYQAVGELRGRFVQDLLFLSKFRNRSENIVYFGDHGDHLYALLTLFPHHNFLFVGENKIHLDSKYLVETNFRVISFRNFNLAQESSSFREGYQNEKDPNSKIRNPLRCLLISHRKDQENNKKLVENFLPVAALLHFNPEELNSENSTVNYLAGEVILPVYEGYKSRNSYLQIDEKDEYAVKSYGIKSYKNRLYYYNALLRPWSKVNNGFVFDQSMISGFVSNVEQSIEVMAWILYFLIDINDSNTFSQSQNLISMMMNKISAYLGQSLNFELSKEIVFRSPLEIPFKVPNFKKPSPVLAPQEDKSFNYDMVPSNVYYDPQNEILATLPVNRDQSNLFEIIRLVSNHHNRSKTVLLHCLDSKKAELYKTTLDNLFKKVKFLVIKRSRDILSYTTEPVLLFMDIYPSEEEAKSMEFNALEAKLAKAYQEYFKVLNKVKPDAASIVFRPVGSESSTFMSGYYHFGVLISPYNHFAYLELVWQRDGIQQLNLYKSREYNRTTHQNKVYYHAIKVRTNENYDQETMDNIGKDYYEKYLYADKSNAQTNKADLLKLRNFIISAYP